MVIISRKNKRKVIVAPKLKPKLKLTVHAPTPTRAIAVVVKPADAAVRRAFKQGRAGQLHESERRKKLEMLMLSNVGKPHPLTLEEMMLEAGYAASTARAHSPSIIEAARSSSVVQTHLQKLIELRDKTVKRLEEETPDANYGQLAFGVQVLDKSIQMLEGRPDDKKETGLDEEERAMLDEILEMNE